MQLKYPDLPEKLSSLVRFATVSSFDPENENEQTFSALKDSLKTLYPRVHAAIKREEIGSRALLYTWEGTKKDLQPVILCAHFDVVPPGDEKYWKFGPFSGEITNTEIWGRGTQDIKVLMASILEAAEILLSRGFKPERSVYFAFGGDEEIGGVRGARLIGENLKQKGVKALFLLDEGGPIGKGMLSFVKQPLALIGVAEKGYADIMLEAKGNPGHASMPPKRTAPGQLARALLALEKNPFPARLTQTMQSFLSAIAPVSSPVYRFIFNNTWLTAGLLKMAFANSPSTNALIRTTAACTMLSGSNKENVLAETAKAVINVRMLPGDSPERVVAHLEQLCSPFGVSVKTKGAEFVVPHSPESSSKSEGWRLVTEALRESHPDAVSAPFLFSAGTDTKHYREVAQDIYRFTALYQSQEDLKGVHGYDERVRKDNLDACADFYVHLLKRI